MLKTNITMLKASTFERGLYRYDGNSIVADVDRTELEKGTYVASIQYNEDSTKLIITMSDGTVFNVLNFVAIDAELSAEALRKKGFTGGPGRMGRAAHNGLDGRKGMPGSRGYNGRIGERGDQGVDGPIGNYGPDGPYGNIGAQGLIGPKGEQGDRGDRGQQGVHGKDGKSNIIISASTPLPKQYTDIKQPVWVGY